MSGNSPASAERRIGSPRWSGSSRSGKRLPTISCGCTGCPPRPLGRSGDGDGKVRIRVDVPALQAEPRGGEHGLSGPAGELVAALCPDALFGRHAYVEPQPAELHVLRNTGNEVHLDARLGLVVERDMAEGLRLEVAVDAAVDDLEDVPVECPGHAARVVVGGFEQYLVLDQVEAEEETVLGSAEQRAYLGEQPLPGWRIEVADRAPEKKHEAAADRGRHVLQVPFEVPDDCVHVEKGIVGEELLRAGLDGRPVHVDSDITDGLPEAIPGIEQQAGFRRRSRSQLDDVHRRQLQHELGRQRLEELCLRPRQVVLGHPGDLLEELGSDRVVEVLRWQGLRAGREPATHVVLEPLAPAGFGGIRVRAIAHGHWSASPDATHARSQDSEGSPARADDQAGVSTSRIPTYTLGRGRTPWPRQCLSASPPNGRARTESSSWFPQALSSRGRSRCGIRSSSTSDTCRPSRGITSAPVSSDAHRSTRHSTSSSPAASIPMSTTPPTVTRTRRSRIAGLRWPRCSPTATASGPRC